MLGDIACGKGTQAELIGDSISSGQLGRDECDRNPVFKAEYAPIMSQGNYLPGKVMLGLIKAAIPTVADFPGVKVIDGFPRDKEQAGWIGSIYRHPELLIAFNITISEETALARSKARYLKDGRPDDYNPETILHRYRLWRKHRKNVIRKLRSQGVLVIDIAGEQSKDQVRQTIAAEFSKHLRELQARTRRQERVQALKTDRIEQSKPRRQQRLGLRRALSIDSN